MQRKWILPLALAVIATGAVAPFAIAKAVEPPIKGSIQLPREQAGHQENDRAEAARLKALAKITPEQAVAAARKHSGGQGKIAELEEEDGFLVYSVETNGKEVLVDAGNGRVLGLERSEGKDSQRSEEKNERRSEGNRPADHEDEADHD